MRMAGTVLGLEMTCKVLCAKTGGLPQAFLRILAADVGQAARMPHRRPIYSGASRVVSLGPCVSGTASLALRLWHWVSGTASLALGLWHWVSGTGSLALGLWHWVSGSVSLAVCPWAVRLWL